ncbi:ABC transporter substrate-binding protein [Natrinema ejinorense]|uniref:Sugar ABC transporter substrate-binding protein n=1 Tax=Natrinema ejinorense TaxID=373386 RepID=A0A2A5QYL6_9EURY|nr:ABC transporter substrate-binding protein [Natrinema ejinorense]PCR91917.1 sugar ABC transporter substrate-binding protein [Natrinema ejinorense]
MLQNDDTTDAALNRRRVLGAMGAAGGLALAGCLGGGGSAADSLEDALDDDLEESEYETLEIGHWWTAGGEADALAALMSGFEEEFPDIDYELQDSPGGGGSALETDVRSRVVDNDPPSTFQIWPGQALTTYTNDDLLFDIGEHVWESDMQDAYLQGPEDQAQIDGTYYAVPINIHRLNNVFYNVSVLEDAGVDPESLESPSDLVDALSAVDDAGYTGFAQSTDTFMMVQLWAVTLLAEGGVDTYESVIGGDVSGNEETVRSSLETVVEFSEYFPGDASSVAWDEANGDVISGDAAFHHNGDWAAGQYLGEDGFEFEDDWDYIPFPGTDGQYALNMDSFVFPKYNPSPNATLAFLQYVGTADAQRRFNQEKGSIPPRNDVETGEFTNFHQRQIDQFQSSDAQPPSMAHGLALPPGQQSGVESAMTAMAENWDADEAYDGIVDTLE